MVDHIFVLLYRWKYGFKIVEVSVRSYYASRSSNIRCQSVVIKMTSSVTSLINRSSKSASLRRQHRTSPLMSVAWRSKMSLNVTSRRRHHLVLMAQVLVVTAASGTALSRGRTASLAPNWSTSGIGQRQSMMIRGSGRKVVPQSTSWTFDVNVTSPASDTGDCADSHSARKNEFPSHSPLERILTLG